MQAKFIARALETLTANPSRSLASIADSIGLKAPSLISYVGQGGVCKQLDTIAAFPDFSEHAKSITDSLERLGHKEQADELLSRLDGRRPELEEDAATAATGSGRSRQISAEQVYEALEHRVTTGKNLKGTSLKQWVVPAVWKKRNLAETLSRKSDYPEWRDRIELRAKQLGIIGGDETLPPPSDAATRDTINAYQLVAGLQAIQERKQAKSEGRSGLSSVVEAWRSICGTSARSPTLANWIKADGTLRTSATRIHYLDGYEEVSGELKQLFSDLGQTDTAASLSGNTARWQTEMRAEKVARALEMIADNPNQSRHAISVKLDVPRSTLDSYIAPDGSAKDPDRLANLRDYASSYDSLRSALLRVGRPDQAQALLEPHMVQPAASVNPQMSAHDFVDLAKGQLDKVVEAATSLRSDPSSWELLAATPSAHASIELVRTLLDERGRVRDAQSIGQTLTKVDSAASARLERLVDGLSKRLEKAPKKTPQQALMKPLLLKGAGLAGHRVAIVDHSTKDPGYGRQDRLEKIYSTNPSLIREPRSYASDRQRQPLRWLSTVLKEQFPRGREIQSYYDRQSRSIVVSSNGASVNGELESFLHSGELEKLLAEEAPRSVPTNASREDRHKAKILRRMNPAEDPHPTQDSDEVWAAIAERRYRVPRHEGSPGLHAERRIANHVARQTGTSMDLTQLAGTMRPCSTCADQIGAGPDEHRGPFWMSSAARAGVDGYADIQRHAREGMGTSVTHTRDGRYTFRYDTDSDSDIV